MSKDFERAYEKNLALRDISAGAKQQIKQVANATDMEYAAAKRLTNFFYTKGKGVSANDILALDENYQGKADILSKLFNRLMTVLDDFKRASLLEELDPYITALAEHGITLAVAPTYQNRYANVIRDDLTAVANDAYAEWYQKSKELSENDIALLVNKGELLSRHFSKLCLAKRKLEQDKPVDVIISGLQEEADITMNETGLISNTKEQDESDSN